MSEPRDTSSRDHELPAFRRAGDGRAPVHLPGHARAGSWCWCPDSRCRLRSRSSTRCTWCRAPLDSPARSCASSGSPGGRARDARGADPVRHRAPCECAAAARLERLARRADRAPGVHRAHARATGRCARHPRRLCAGLPGRPHHANRPRSALSAQCSSLVTPHTTIASRCLPTVGLSGTCHAFDTTPNTHGSAAPEPARGR